MRIPQAVEAAIVRTRDHFRQMNERARERSGGSFGFVTKPEALEEELAFWEMEDDDELEEFLFGDLLAALYGSDVDLDELPEGYAPLLRVLEFERHCQFEGWTAVSNRADEMPAIIDGYRQLGLADEARALERVWAAYQELADDGREEFNDKLGRAYRAAPNATPEIEDRMPLILAHVRANPVAYAGV